MKDGSKQGTWAVRQLIRLSTVILGILIFWLLGFLVEDIEDLPGPNYNVIEQKYVDPNLVEQSKKLNAAITELSRQIANRQEDQRLVGDSSENLRRTISQLLQIQQLGIQKGIAISEPEKENLIASQRQFLESQKNYQELNKKIADLTAEKQAREDELRTIEEQLRKQREAAQKELQTASERHRLRLAFYQLGVLLPLLILAGWLLLNRRGNLYYPLFLAFGGATLVKVALVVHEYFPTRYFKYVLVGVLILVVGRFLVYLIRLVAFPRKEWLERQFREAYERFLCPICEYPIRTGPRKYLYWTRRTVNKVLPSTSAALEAETPYVCPACGTAVFETCPTCGKVRHALLTHCYHCGAKKEAV